MSELTALIEGLGKVLQITSDLLSIPSSPNHFGAKMSSTRQLHYIPSSTVILNIVEHLSAGGDTRSDIKQKHNLIDVMFLVISAIASGCVLARH